MYVRQLTQGRGSFTLKMLRYEQLPANLVDKVISEQGMAE